ncbi:MAG: polyprenyl synthetase family protein [Candidatus Tectomicrobia bacterium]|nr:polyprenyl synthetase family protein [Candidatus Tectomicrobia bacterium]
MGFQDIVKILGGDLEAVEEEMQKHFMIDVERISEVGKYMLLRKGKRIRAILLLLSARMFNYSGPRAFILSTAIEFIHAATLLHDDVLDNSLLRRGYPSVNMKWGNETSILVGDFLYAKAMNLVVEDRNWPILREISHATVEMVKGQVLETLKLRDLAILEEEYFQIITKKSAYLIATCCYIGAVLGGASPEETSALREFGLNFGIAFQLVDDVLDFVAREDKLGKPVGSDLKEGKLTLPIIATLKRARLSEIDVIRAFVNGTRNSPEDFQQIVGIINLYRMLDYTMAEARRYIEKAKEPLEIFNGSDLRHLLIDLSDYILERDG